MQDVLDIINQAAAGGDWILLAVGAVALIVPIVLKALGKSVPVVDQIISVVLKVATSLRKPKAPPAVEPGKPEGIAAVIKIEDGTKKE